MKRITCMFLAATLLISSAFALPADAVTFADVLGDVSRGNHPLAGLEGTKIIVPRPAKSKYEPVAVLDLAGIVLSDITGHWAEDNIRRCVDAGLIGGYPDGSFRPDEAVSYAEIATILARLHLKPVRFTGGKTMFHGTSQEKWHYNAFMILYETGFVHGQFTKADVTNKRPDDKAERQIVSILLSQMLEYSANIGNYSLNFTDAKSISNDGDGFVAEAVSRMVFYGIISGYADGSFRPEGEVTRAEFVTMLCRVLDKYSWDKGMIHDNLYGNYNMPIWQDELEILRLANEERAKVGVNPVEYDPDLQALARIKVIDQAVNNYTGHISPTFGDPNQMSQKARSYESVGENATTNNTVHAHGNWCRSENHHKNMISSKHTYGAAAIGETTAVEWFAGNGTWIYSK